MTGNAKPMLKFLDGSDNRFIIPVYQRNYDWTEKQCKQLFNDLIQVAKENRKSHFFGSIVSSHAKDGSKSDFLIIDGQQRITTISILFTAMVNSIKKEQKFVESQRLAEKIEKKFLVDEFSPDERKLRLKPIKDDMEAFDKLLTDNISDFVVGSNITTNYSFFIEEIRKMPISIDQLYSAIERLEIIDIFVEDGEDPQLIFESLNSTGLDLTEADKIRNFILMRLDDEKQELFYKNYWNKIEKLTCLNGTKKYRVSEFIRHYLTLRTRKIPKIEEVYSVFKEYVLDKIKMGKTLDCESVLKEMLDFAQIYNKIINSSFSSRKISQILKRLNHIEMTVLYPFFLDFFKMHENQEISEEETRKVLKCIESFIFRRIICPGYATNALNKIFCTLHSEVMKDLEEGKSYSEILIYTLENKTGSSGFPKDSEFIQALKTANIYKMQKKNKEYLFERLENEDSVEYVNVIELMNDNEREKKLTIEHIMPQTLSQQWRISLGENNQEIHDSKLHTLGNLTLTGYNTNYSNRTFIEKRDCENGYKESGLRLNRTLCNLEKWGLEEIEARCDWLIEKAIKTWDYPATNYVPKVQDNKDKVTLEDADNLTGRKLFSYIYGDSDEQKCDSWVKMFTDVVNQLYQEDSSVFRKLAEEKNYSSIFFSNEKDKRGCFEISTGLFLIINNDVNSKLRILSRIFKELEKDKSELTFKLQPLELK